MLTYGPRRVLLQPGTAQSTQPFVDPSSLPGLILWLDAGSGTYSDTGLTTPQASDAGAVAGWASRTGTNPVLQATAGAQPTLRTAVVNGRSVLRFDGTDDRLVSAALAVAEGQPNTVFGVMKKAGADSAISHVMLGRSNTSAAFNQLGTNGGGSYRINASSSITKAATMTNWNIVAGLFNTTASKIWLNGGSPTTGSTGSSALNGFAIGAQSDGTSPYGGDIAEVIVYSSGLTTAQVNSVVAYLGTKYNITVTTAT